MLRSGIVIDSAKIVVLVPKRSSQSNTFIGKVDGTKGEKYGRAVMM